VSDPHDTSPIPEPEPDVSEAPMRSPIRPTPPKDETPQADPSLDVTPPLSPIQDDPQAALDALRRKMEVVANEFSQGKINRAQFNAIYGRYGEQRTIIERLIERNPENQAWKQAAAPGHTSFLRDHFEARLLYYLVYQHDTPAPLTMGGSQQPEMDTVSQVLKMLWGMKNRPRVGLARKDMTNGRWMILATGEYAVTLTLFLLEPSIAQANLVRDLHADFERANRRALERGTRSLDRFVFPQRALTEKRF
jgi:hypothetical protein